MGLNDTVSAERFKISFFGRCNAGKSSLINAITGQELSVVSEVAGTTTDPVKKAMELLPVGPVMIVDTAGLDDIGELSDKRIQKTEEVLRSTDMAVLVIDGREGILAHDKEQISLYLKKKIPYIVVYTKSDLLDKIPKAEENSIYVSSLTRSGIYELKELIGKKAKNYSHEKPIVSDLLKKGDTAVLVVPIDKAAPKGRLILPQQMVIRDLLDGGMQALVCRDSELRETLDKLRDLPDIVITDSQVFGKIKDLVPEEVPLTSFSILMARYKGTLGQALEGAAMLDKIKDGDSILISEGCTHHRQCGDIGTVKLPNLIRKKTGCDPEFSFTSGGTFPGDLSEYNLIIHCGGCMLNEKEMAYRADAALSQGIPFTNYGIVLAKLNGILNRSIKNVI
ncbi:MAG: [FeFe] hydrogenase H-cluster maturation GTPase HydF [Lachnospiraceae bacterium]|nr:[FeFe] hydrogenase H-cluster maturation GTPase HydF [Lachnospiraceae bacterium]